MIKNILVGALVVPLLVTLGCVTHQPPVDLPEMTESTGSIEPEVVSPPRGLSSVMKLHDGAFDWPVDQARLTQRFHRLGRRPHFGIDLAANRGSKIYSAHDGVVLYTGRAFHGYGKLIIIKQNNTWSTFYSHLDRMLVKEGQRIERGQLIGLMGRTGRATGVHLHFEIRNHLEPIDPLPYLPNGRQIEAKL